MDDERFEEALGSLYAGPPEDFVAERNGLVRRLRGEGERELAKRVATLRRPSLSLWLANRLHEVAPDRLRELMAAGGELQQAQAAAASGDAAARRRFRELIGRHSQLIDALVRIGLALAEERGHGAGDEVGRRLAATLRAASTGEDEKENAARLLQGRLLNELEPAGFESLGLLPTTAARSAEGTADAAARSAEARRLAAEKERAAVAARTRADELRRRAETLARQAREAREEADAAEQEARQAETEAAEAQRAAVKPG